MDRLQLWGGHECTVNRVGDGVHDQTVRTGHHDRAEDLDLFAGLGLRTLRYPVLWERVARDNPGQMDWSWTDARLARMATLGIEPIAGLVHHGSGPRYTGLLDPGFAPGLARFARAAAERYPHVMDWTPVNEPLTTARFSMLYGHWHPHLTDERAFWTALFNQVEATAAAMSEIRAVNPAARLIQTEDLGRTCSTPPVVGQADFDNTRRWMTWDLLFGHVTQGHPLWRRLAARGFADRLKRIADNPCPPDVLGINHYLTSDRFLDHDVGRYPPHTHGGNVMQRFADVEAIRVMSPPPPGLRGALEEAWDRYGTTLAVTECHLGCTREEQARWLIECWDTAQQLRAGGVDIRAVTAWSLLGAYDWDSLLTQPTGSYESGAFDVRNGQPRPTVVAATIAALCAGEPEQAPPAAAGPGWWRRDIRLTYSPVRVIDAAPASTWRPPPGPSRPILIFGAASVLGDAFAAACEWRGLQYVLTERLEAGQHHAWAVIDLTGEGSALTPTGDTAAFVQAVLNQVVDGVGGVWRTTSKDRAIPPPAYAGECAG